jgi:hypothetical protein
MPPVFSYSERSAGVKDLACFLQARICARLQLLVAKLDGKVHLELILQEASWDFHI